MCWCTPEIRTPFCGKPGCHPPRQQPAGLNRDATEMAATAVRLAGSASTELAWALSRGETGPAFYERVRAAQEMLLTATGYLSRVRLENDRAVTEASRS